MTTTLVQVWKQLWKWRGSEIKIWQHELEFDGPLCFPNMGCRRTAHGRPYRRIHCEQESEEALDCRQQDQGIWRTSYGVVDRLQFHVEPGFSMKYGDLDPQHTAQLAEEAEQVVLVALSDRVFIQKEVDKINVLERWQALRRTFHGDYEGLALAKGVSNIKTDLVHEAQRLMN